MTLQEFIEKELGPYEVWQGRRSLVEGNWRRMPFRLTAPLGTKVSEGDQAILLAGIAKVLKVYNISKEEVTKWSLFPDYSLGVNKK